MTRTTPIGMPPTSDRLASTLFVATLLHGLIILGITFSPEGFMPSESLTLEVTLVSGPADDTPENAEFFAQQNRLASGGTETDQRARSLPSTLAPMTRSGRLEAQDLRDSSPGERLSQSEVIASRASSAQVSVNSEANTRPDTVKREAFLMLASNFANAPMDVQEILPAADDVRRDTLSVSSLQSNFANYLGAWKQKVERIGTINYPDQIRRRGMSGNPVLEVAINADGTLREIIVRRSSSYKLLDQAALQILQLAAPFEPFPEEVRSEYDVLRFVYEWQFLDGNLGAGTVELSKDGS